MEHHYRLAEKYGEGTYGSVFKAIHIPTNSLVAIKKVSNVAKEDGIPVEVKYLERLKDSPNVVRLREYFNVGISELWIVMDFIEGDLWRIMSNHAHTLTLGNIKYYIRQLLEAVYQCHSKGIMHRDIKPANLLINRDGDLKLTDFGLSTSFQQLCEGKLSNNVVSLYYRPPELLLGSSNYGPEIDIWSVGCVLMEMIKGHYLFAGVDEKEQLEQIFAIFGTPTEIDWPGISSLPRWTPFVTNMRLHRPRRSLTEYFCDLSPYLPLLFDLANKMLTLDPKKRITSYEALNHPFFTLPNSSAIDNAIDSLVPIHPNFIHHLAYYYSNQQKQHQHQQHNRHHHNNNNQYLTNNNNNNGFYRNHQQQAYNNNNVHNNSSYQPVDIISRHQHHQQEQHLQHLQHQPQQQQYLQPTSKFHKPTPEYQVSHQISAQSTPTNFYYSTPPNDQPYFNSFPPPPPQAQQAPPPSTSHHLHVHQPPPPPPNQKYLFDINPYSESYQHQPPQRMQDYYSAPSISSMNQQDSGIYGLAEQQSFSQPKPIYFYSHPTNSHPNHQHQHQQNHHVYHQQQDHQHQQQQIALYFQQQQLLQQQQQLDNQYEIGVLDDVDYYDSSDEEDEEYDEIYARAIDDTNQHNSNNNHGIINHYPSYDINYDHHHQQQSQSQQNAVTNNNNTINSNHHYIHIGYNNNNNNNGNSYKSGIGDFPYPSKCQGLTYITGNPHNPIVIS